jgi:hypothetical protein
MPMCSSILVGLNYVHMSAYYRHVSAYANRVALICAKTNAFQAKRGYKHHQREFVTGNEIPSMLMKEAQPLRTDARECEQSREG